MTATTHKKIRTKIILKAVLFCVAFTGLFIVLSFTKNFFPNSNERLVHGLIGTLAGMLATWLFLKLDRKKFSDIGLVFQRHTITKFLAGTLAGIIIMGILAFGVLYFSNARIEANPNSNVLHFLLVTLPLIPLAFMEEVGFRAYPLEILKDKIGIRLAIIVTSTLFALYHIANGWTMDSSFYGPGIWGLVFGLAAVYSKGIALSTGIHYAANLTTSAFGSDNNTISVWTVTHSSPPITKGIDWTTILPPAALLVFAIICLELYMRRKPAANHALVNAGLTEEQSP